MLFVIGLFMSFPGARGLPAGHDRAHHVHSRAVGVAGDDVLHGDGHISAIGTLVWRHPLADVSAKAAAPIGAAFTFLALLTGSLWGKPMWGTWWVWDARLTSVFVLLLLYLGLIALNRAMDDPSRAARVSAILILVGYVNIPIIKFSVDWWNTLHQPASVLRLDGPTIHPSMLYPLLVMALAFTMLFFHAAPDGDAHTRSGGGGWTSLRRQAARSAA